MEIYKVKQSKTAYESTANIYIDAKRAPINDFIECNKKIYVSLEELGAITKSEFSYDENKKNFFFGGVPAGRNYINDVCCPVSFVNCEILRKFSYKNAVYRNVMIFENSYPDKPHFAEIEYRLNGLYKKFSFELIKLMDNNEDEVIFWITGENFADDTFDLKKIESGQKVELNVTGRNYMRLYFLSLESQFKYAVVNAYLE